MDTTHMKELLIGLLSYVLELNFRALRFVLHSFQGGIWSLSRMPKDTCEILKIVAKKTNYYSFDVHEYLWLHERFDNVDVLLDDHWMMHKVSQKHAYFIRLPESMKNYNAIRDPFVAIAAFETSTHLARMPIDAFKDYWSDRPSKGRMAILQSGSRCGSTLLMKMLSVDPDRVVAISEPDLFTSLQTRLLLKEWFKESDQEYARLFRAGINALRKNISEDQLLVTKSFSCELFEHFHNVCPEIMHLCLFRKDVPAMFRSMERTIIQLDREYCTYRWTLSAYLVPILPAMMVLGMQPAFQPFIPSAVTFDPRTFRESAAVQLAAAAKSYIDNGKALALPVIFYEDLVERPLEIIAEIFGALKMPTSPLSVDALELTQGDSQAGTALSRSKMATIHLDPMVDVKRLQEIAQYYGLQRNFFFEKLESSLTH